MTNELREQLIGWLIRYKQDVCDRKDWACFWREGLLGLEVLTDEELAREFYKETDDEHCDDDEETGYEEEETETTRLYKLVLKEYGKTPPSDENEKIWLSFTPKDGFKRELSGLATKQ